MKMILRGKIANGSMFNDFTSIDIIQDDGYKIDIVTRLMEFTYNYGKNISLKYWIAKNKDDDETIKINTLKEIMGIVNVGYETEEYAYSEYTFGTYYNTILDIDGHNLYNELTGNVGKYIIFEIESV